MAVAVETGLAALAERYDAFILDLWGVIHDGTTPYPGAADTLARLRQAGRRTLLLSNAPRRARALVERMTAMGIARDLYGAVLCSGEAVRAELLARTDPFFAALGPRCLHIGPDRDRNVLDDVAATVVTEAAAADWVLNTGPVSFDDDPADYDAVLRQSRARDLPMVCANPDRLVIAQGRKVWCAGVLADRYLDLGGRVVQRGKPDPAIYHMALAELGNPDPRRVAVVGDALHTDIAGAAAAGLDGVLVAGGIHAEDLGLPHWGAPPDPEQVTALAAAHGLMPVAAVPAFVW